MFYLYRCMVCGKEKEVRHSIKEEPIILCDEDDERMNRVITGGAGTIFKGLGWASKGTATAPKPQHVYEHTKVMPVFKKGYKPEGD